MEVWEAIRSDIEKGAKWLVAEYWDRLFGSSLVLCKDEHAAVVRKAVSCLSPTLREVVMLRYFEDKTLQEMANLMSVPVGTVKWRLHQARSDLERMLSRIFKEKEV